MSLKYASQYASVHHKQFVFNCSYCQYVGKNFIGEWIFVEL